MSWGQCIIVTAHEDVSVSIVQTCIHVFGWILSLHAVVFEECFTEIYVLGGGGDVKGGVLI